MTQNSKTIYTKKNNKKITEDHKTFYWRVHSPLRTFKTKTKLRVLTSVCVRSGRGCCLRFTFRHVRCCNSCFLDLFIHECKRLPNINMGTNTYLRTFFILFVNLDQHVMCNLTECRRISECW